jgi:hypothetical protein
MMVKRLGLALSFVLLTAACSGEGPGPAEMDSAHVEPRRIALTVAGRSNYAPAVAALGKLVAVVWTAGTDARSDIYVSVSNDAGATFGAPVRVNDVDGDARASGEQAARVAIGYGGAVHVVWPARQGAEAVLRYASSTDRAQSFSKAVTIAGENIAGARGWQSLALGYDGGVHVVWLDGRNASPSNGHRGRHAGHTKVGQHASTLAAVDAAPRQDVFHASWAARAPGGVDRFEKAVAANVCFCCKTAVATSGDRVFAAWRHIYPGGIRDIAVARSTDNGRTFEAPVRLSVDEWKISGCPDDGPSMAADGHGGIHVAWPTLVTGDVPRKAIFYASRSEGQDFTPRLRLDAGNTDPAHPQIGLMNTATPQSSGTSARVAGVESSSAASRTARRRPPKSLKAMALTIPSSPPRKATGSLSGPLKRRTARR